MIVGFQGDNTPNPRNHHHRGGGGRGGLQACTIYIYIYIYIYIVYYIVYIYKIHLLMISGISDLEHTNDFGNGQGTNQSCYGFLAHD